MEESGVSKIKGESFFIDILVLFIAVLVAGLFTFCSALIAEHATGYTNSCLMFSCYFILMITFIDVFAPHRAFFSLVVLWQFYRNLNFAYDTWPNELLQQRRIDNNLLFSCIHLVFSTLICFPLAHRLQFMGICFVLGTVSIFQVNPGNDDEEWTQTANMIIFCILYSIAHVVRRLENGNVETVVFQCVWALQTNNFILLGVGMVLQLLVYNYLLFSQSTQTDKNK